MPEGYYNIEGDTVPWTPTSALSGGDVVQITDGRAGIAATDIDAGKVGSIQVEGIVLLAKTASMVMLNGSRIYWDASANKAHLLQVNDADFYVGICQADAAASDTTVKVAMNVDRSETICLGDGFWSVPVRTAGWCDVIGHADGVSLLFDVTNEAQKVDALSTRAIAVDTPCIVEALICVNLNGDDAAFDFNCGIANASHATDADSITEALFVHTDGNSLDISAASRDGTTTVAITDTTVNFAVGTPFLVQFDLRDYADIQMYVNGVNVLPDTVFKLDAATGPLKLLAHMEKSANDSPGNITVMDLCLRTFNV